MPQGHRKKPFSGKVKKEQLKAKKHGKTSNLQLQHDTDGEGDTVRVKKINYQPGGKDKNRYVLQFMAETAEEIRQRKELARQALRHVSEKELEVSAAEFFPKELDFPVRPPWSFDMSREALDAQENKYFREYLNGIEEKFNLKELSFFELNLETWRQLWRVLEMSDVILLIVDIRFSALMFPPSLYDYIKRHNKDMILVLNKIDLAPAPLVAAWKNFFKDNYPDLHIIMFTTLPGYNLIGNSLSETGLQVRRRKGKIRLAAEGTQLLLEACKTIVGDNVDLTSWQKKIQEEMTQEYEDEEIEIAETVLKKPDTDYCEYRKFADKILTIGCVGQPNVGKSSLINAVMGKKVVSVSKTPGHTKHFQTIFITENVKLCDCPGLVFPSKVPRALQVLMGSFPIAQLREPYTTVQYLAERLDLPKLLKIDHPENDEEWSAMDICDGWAKKKGFKTAKAARLDTYRAANHLLRMSLDGKICLCLRPPGYTDQKEFWSKHEDVKIVKWIQAKSEEEIASVIPDESTDSEHETEPSDKESQDSSDGDVAVSSNKFTALCQD